MNIEDVENYIADTTGSVSEPEDESAVLACPCGAYFSNRDLGVSMTLKRCAVCYTAIRNELCESSAGGSVASVPATDASTVSKADALTEGEPSAGVGAEAEDDDTADVASLDVLAAGAGNESFANAVSDIATAGAFPDDAAATGTLTTGAMHDDADGMCHAAPACNSFPPESSLSMEEIEVAMAAATADSFRCFNIILNGKSELFTFHLDPIEAGNRKLFQRASWPTALLYGYNIFGSMMTPRGKTLITPSAFRDKKGNIYILVAIGKTLCNRPRYDGLVVAIEDDKASFVKNISAFVSECLLDFPFDGDLIDRIVVDFIDRNRMIYDPGRGLPRDCKYPMKSDAELKKYMKSVASANEVTGDSGIGKPHKEIPKAVPLPRKAPIKPRKERVTRVTKRKRLPSKPPTIEVELLSEECDISSESDEDPAPPKRGCRATMKPFEPILIDPSPVVTPPALLAQTVNLPAPYVHTVSSGVIPFTPSVAPAAPALPLPPEPALPLPLAPMMLPNLPCPNDHQQFVNAPSGNCYAMLSGLFYDSIVQKTKLDELQKREEKRQHEEARFAFQKQMMSMLGEFK